MGFMTPRWLSRVYHYLKGPHPLHPDVLDNHLTPMIFRRYRPEDLAQCIELYAANEPGRFPTGVIELYRRCLSDQTSYFLVLERDNQIVASGGLSFFMRPDVAVLSFGLVHPEYQGSGIGTALLLARLALLPTHRYAYVVFIFAVEKSVGFYRRFGFRQFRPWVDQHGQKHPSAVLAFSSREIGRCRKLLAERGISFPQDHDMIPLRDKSDWVDPDRPRQ